MLTAALKVRRNLLVILIAYSPVSGVFFALYVNMVQVSRLKTFKVSKVRILKAYFLALVLLLSAPYSMAQVQDKTHPWRSEDARMGYSDRTDQEDERFGEALYQIENPYKNEATLQEKMFDENLSREIINRYQEQFGRTEAEIVQRRTPYLNTGMSEGEVQVFNEEDYQKRQRSFGNYTIKRFFEYQLEAKSKENKEIKKVYDAKSKIEKVSFSLSGNVKIRLRYHISSNNFVLLIKNPWIDFQTRFEMGGDKERVISVSKDLSRGYSILSDYYIGGSSSLDIIGRKTITENLSTSLTVSPFKHYEITENRYTHAINERRALLGLNYRF